MELLWLLGSDPDSGSPLAVHDDALIWFKQPTTFQHFPFDPFCFDVICPILHASVLSKLRVWEGICPTCWVVMLCVNVCSLCSEEEKLSTSEEASAKYAVGEGAESVKSSPAPAQPAASCPRARSDVFGCVMAKALNWFKEQNQIGRASCRERV